MTVVRALLPLDVYQGLAKMRDELAPPPRNGDGGGAHIPPLPSLPSALEGLEQPKASQVVDSLGTIVPTPPAAIAAELEPIGSIPRTESVARELARLSPDEVAS